MGTSASLGRLCLAGLSFGIIACGQSSPTPQASPTAPAASATVSSDWPTYGHDASRTGFNAGETMLSPNNVAQLTQAFQVNIGIGGAPSSSTPTIAKGTVFVGSSVPGSPNFFALDATTGKTIWTANLNYVANCELVGVGSTAATDGSVVAAGGADGAYYGLDFQTGAILWRNAIGAGPSGFAWSSPLLASGRVYVGIASACDNPSVRGELRALDEHTGALLSDQFFVPAGTIGAGVWNSPTLKPDGGSVFVATGEDDGTHGLYEQAMLALDPQSLSVQAAFKEGMTSGDLDFVSTPIVFHDASGRELVGASHKDQLFYAFGTSSISAGPVWQRDLGAVIGMMPAYDPTLGAGGTLFVFGTDPQGTPELHALDPGTGADRWIRMGVGQVFANMAIANGMIFLNVGGGGLKILDEKNGQTITIVNPPGAGNTYSGVSVAGGTVYWVAGSFLNAWRLP